MVRIWYQCCTHLLPISYIPIWQKFNMNLLSMWYEYGTILVRIWYQSGTKLVPIWYESGSSFVQCNTNLVRICYQCCTHVLPIWYQSGRNPVPIWVNMVQFWYQSCTHVLPSWYQSNINLPTHICSFFIGGSADIVHLLPFQYVALGAGRETRHRKQTGTCNISTDATRLYKHAKLFNELAGASN